MFTVEFSIGLMLLVLFILIGVYALYHVNLSGDLIAAIFVVLILILVGILLVSIPCTGYQIIQLGNLTFTPAQCAKYV
jgi:hypothetical protein